MNLLFGLTPMFCPLGKGMAHWASGGGAIPATTELGTEILVWGMGTRHGTCLTPIPQLPVPPQEKSPQMLKGASGRAFPWVNTLIY